MHAGLDPHKKSPEEVDKKLDQLTSSIEEYVQNLELLTLQSVDPDKGDRKAKSQLHAFATVETHLSISYRYWLRISWSSRSADNCFTVIVTKDGDSSSEEYLVQEACTKSNLRETIRSVLEEYEKIKSDPNYVSELERDATNLLHQLTAPQSMPRDLGSSE